MINLVTVFFVAANYIAAAVNTYHWADGGETASVNLGMAVFNFGVAQFITAFGLRK